MICSFRLLFLLLTFSSFVFAEPLRYSFSTEVQDFYLNPKNSANLFTKYEFKIAGSHELNPSFTLKSNATINYVQLLKQDQKKILLNPTDFGIYYSNSVLDLNLGGWTLSPEGTDLNNIFEVIHGRDYRQPFSADNLASFGALFDLHAGKLDFKIFYIPLNTKSLLPDTQSAWWPRTDALPVTNSAGTFLLPDNISYVYRNEDELNHPFENNFGALGKLSFSLIDFYSFYFSGANQIPQVSPHFNIDITSLTPLVGVVRPPVQLDLTWIRSDHIGGGLSLAIDPIIFKAFCKNQKDFYTEPSSSSACTFALESSLIFSKYTLRYFLQANRLWKKSPAVSELETLLGFFEKSTALGFLLDLNPENIISGAVVYNEKSPAYLTSLRYERKWTDRFKTILGVNVITVQDDPIAKAYDQTDNASLKLNYDY